MSSLATLQQCFQAYLLGTPGEGDISTAIVDDARVGAKQRLSIYHDAYRLRLVEALAKTHPNLAKLMGEDLFDRMARAYIAGHPSIHRNLRWYGSELPAHLAAALPQHLIAAELAAFEWTLALAFDAMDAPFLGIPELAAFPPETWAQLRFTLHPSLHTLDLTLNTGAVWKALEADRTPPAIEPAPATWLIWRKGLDPHFRSLDPIEKQALELAKQDAPFADMCERMNEFEDETAAVERAAQNLATWLADGLITHITAD